MGFHDAFGQWQEFRGQVELSLHDFRLVTAAGAVGDTTANGGVLSSNTAPVMGAEATSEAHSILWAAAGAQIIQAAVALPLDFDGRQDVQVELFVLTDNTGGGGIEPASFTVLTSWDNGSQVTDTATDSVPAVTSHKISTTIAAADVPDAPSFLNIQLVPGTHANDPTKLLAARLTYVRRSKSD